MVSKWYHFGSRPKGWKFWDPSFWDMRLLALYGLAFGFVSLWLANTEPTVLWSGRFGVAGFCLCRWGSWGRLPFARCTSTNSGCRSGGNSPASFRRFPYTDPGRAVGVGLQIGEEKATCGVRFGFGTVGGPRSLESNGARSPCSSDTGFHGDKFYGTKDEVQSCLRSGRRIGVPDSRGSSETNLAPDLHQQDRGHAIGDRRAVSRATFSFAKKAHGRNGPVRRLRSVFALWQEGIACTQIQNLFADTRRWLHYEGSPRSGNLHPMADLLQSLQNRSPDARRHDDGYLGVLRKPRGETGKALQRGLAPSSSSGRLGKIREVESPEGGHSHGDQQRREGTCSLERRQPVGGHDAIVGERFRVLAGTSSCTGKCMAGSWREGHSTHPGREPCSGVYAGRRSSAKGRDGTFESGRIDYTKPKVTKPDKKGGQEEKVCSREGGNFYRKEQRWQYWKRKGQGRTATLLRLEQQQWGLCRPPSRIKLPRKSSKRAQMHKLRKRRTPCACLHEEGVMKDAWRLLILWGRSEKSREQEHLRQEEKSENSRSRSRKHRGHRPGHEGSSSKKERVWVGNKSYSLDSYTRGRKFHFLHFYAGKTDPLSNAIEIEADKRRMAVYITSCEKDTKAPSDKVDLLAEEPYNRFCEYAKAGKWDAFHAGFPCTTFSRLRFRKAKNYPGPCRTRAHPYGLPNNSPAMQKEADEGTLHAARSALIADHILTARAGDTVKPPVTLENPPPSNHEEHLSAWEIEEVSKVVREHEFQEARFTTCKYQQDLPVGQRFLKPQMFAGTLMGLKHLSGDCTCGRDASHIPVVGKEVSVASGRYPEELCKRYANLLLNQFQLMAKAEFVSMRAKQVQEELDRLRTLHEEKKGNVAGKEAGASRNDPPLSATSSKRKHVEDESEREAMRSPSTPRRRHSDRIKLEERKTEETPRAKSKRPERLSREPLRRKPKTEDEATKPKSEEAKGSKLEWQGGAGKYGMLKPSQAKSQDPSKLNFLGGMRNPAEAIASLPNGEALGLRIYAAWERFVTTNPKALDTAETYGTLDCALDGGTMERWKAELRKLTGSRGLARCKLKLKPNKFVYESPITHDILEAWVRRSGDPDTDLARWVSEGVPLGANKEITTKGIFPQADHDPETEIFSDALAQMSQGSISNYSSVQENLEDAKLETQRLIDKGVALVITKSEIEKHFSQGTISRMALIVKERPDKSKKRRLIIDLRRSGGNSKARLPEKLVLPRAMDAIGTARALFNLKPEGNAEELRRHWGREMVLVDIADAFPHFAVHPSELEHCICPHVEGSDFLLFRALLFGYKTAPLLWSRIASWLARALQSCIPLERGQHQVYLDDSFWMFQGTLQERNIALSFVIYTMSALGFEVSVKKGERGGVITWAGLEFRLIPNNEILLTLPEKFLSELQQRLEAWSGKGMAATKELRAVTGKVSWLAGALPRARWILRIFYAVLTDREKEVATGIEEERRKKRNDDRPKENLFVVKRLERARLALLQYLKVAKDRPTRKIALKKRSNARACGDPDRRLTRRTGSNLGSERRHVGCIGVPHRGDGCEDAGLQLQGVLVTGHRRSPGHRFCSACLGQQASRSRSGAHFPGRFRDSSSTAAEEVRWHRRAELLGCLPRHTPRKISSWRSQAAARARSSQ